jgi:hypothetical protein
VLTTLRTAFLVYVRVLLCLQGLCLLILPWLLFVPHGVHGTALWPTLALGLPVALIGLAILATAVLFRRGRRRAAVAAIAIEALWAAAAAALAIEALKDAVDAFEYGRSGSATAVLPVLAVAALLLATVAGLLLRPVRAYSGLVRR